MSRKGKLPIPLPKGVDIKIDSSEITVKGSKGTLHLRMHPAVHVKVEGDHIEVSLSEQYPNEGKLHGLYRSLIQNMVQGTTQGFEKHLEMIGVGYRAAVTGHELDLQIGVSHPSKVRIPDGLQVKVEKNTLITISGVDKQKVGQFAAEIRSKRPPEPYQGKGIRYRGEYVRRKAGKAAAKK